MDSLPNDLQNQLINIKNDELEQFTLNGLSTIGKIVDIYDGDTCRIILIFHNTLYKFNCRLLGLDTPEIKPLKSKINRDEEIKNAHLCKNKLLNLSTSCECDDNIIMTKSQCKKLLELNNKIINIECFNFDKYGRLLVKLYINNDLSISVNEILVNEGYAKSYDGGKKEQFTY